MQDDLVELLGAEEPVAADGRVLRGDLLERLPVRSPAKMMCTTCLAAKLRTGAIESTIATGPSTGTSAPTPTSSASSRWSASTRLSPESTPPPGSSQCSLPSFSCRQSRMLASQRRIAETRIRGSPIRLADEPKPRTPRSLSGSSSTSTGSSSGSGSTTSCAIRIPGSTTNGSRASVLSSTTRTSPR